MSGGPQDEEVLEPVSLRKGTGGEGTRKRGPGPVWLLAALAVWAGAVFWFFSREPVDSAPPSETPATPSVRPDETAGPTPTATSMPESTPTPVSMRESSLLLSSIPTGATVLRDGEYAGVTPFRLVGPKEGEILMIRKEGYEPRRIQLDFPGAKEVLEVSLDPILGTVIIRLAPPDATVTLDGNPVTIPESGEMHLAATAHRFHAEARGFQSLDVTVTPAKAYVREVDLRLRPLPTPTSERAPGEEAPEKSVREENTVGMVLVRPGLPLEVVLGSPRGSSARQSNEVERKARLARGFRISETEVSNGVFRRFKPSHDSGSWKGVNLNADPLPVVNLSWEDAVAFCNWLSAKEGLPPAYVKEGEAWIFQPEPGTGYRLPTEAEWEGLVRSKTGTGLFPWGNKLPPPENVNLAGVESKGKVLPVLERHRDGHVGPAPVDDTWEGPFGVKGLAGNVSEWVHDGYGIPETGSGAAVDPRGEAGKRFHVVKGASWRDAGVVNIRTARRQYGERGRMDLGFRVARYIE